MISILQSFIATGTIPESVKHRRNKDGDDQDGDKSGDVRYQRRKKDEKKKMDDANRSNKEDDGKMSDKDEKKDGKDGKDGKKTASESSSKKNSLMCYHKPTASGVLQWIKGKGFSLIPSEMKKNVKSPCAKKIPHVKHFKCKTVARKPMRKMVNTTTIIARVAGLELPVLDEEYNEDDMAYLRAQRMYEVKVVVNNLEVKYLDGRERILYPGLIEYLHTYDLGRIMALLNYGEENQRKWKIRIAHILKEREDQEKELKRRNEKLKKKKEKELEEMEIKAQELRDKGLC